MSLLYGLPADELGLIADEVDEPAVPLVEIESSAIVRLIDLESGRTSRWLLARIDDDLPAEEQQEVPEQSACAGTRKIRTRSR